MDLVVSVRRGLVFARRAFSGACALAVLAAASRAGVIVVSSTGGGMFTNLQAAVNAASDGDVILVKPGNYAGFTVTDKALDVVADAGGVVRVEGMVLVQQLAAARTFTISGFQLVGSTFQHALRFAFCSGAVRVESCTLESPPQPCGEFRNGDDALDVDVCQNVSVARCTITGGNGGNIPSDFGYGGFGGRGATPVQSRIAFYDCTLRGGAGGGVSPAQCGATQGYGYAGGAGARFLGCTVVFGSGTIFDGGAGSLGSTSSSANSGPSGDGLHVVGAPPYGDSHAWWLGSSWHAGPPACASCPVGTSILVGGAMTTATTIAGTARRFTARYVAREQQLIRMRFEGVPGDQVELFVSEEPRFAFSTSWGGVLLVQSRGPAPAVQAGQIPASGVLEVGWVLGELEPGAQSRRLLLQPSFVGLNGQATLGTPHTLVLLDSAF